MNKVRSNNENIELIWDQEEVKKVMAKHAYLYSGDQRRRELSELWVQEGGHRRTASLGFNNGFYTGMDQIEEAYVVRIEELRKQQMMDHGDKEPGVGIMNIHSANTPVLYISDDGNYAKYLAYDFGVYSRQDEQGGCDSYFISGNIYCELVKERGAWKIWHLILEHDHSVPVGEDYGKIPVDQDPALDPMAEEFGTPPVIRQVHEPKLGWEHLYQDMPKAYYTYDPLHSYGPEGDVGMRYYERERRY